MRVEVLNIIHLACSNHCAHCGYGGILNRDDAARNEEAFSRWLWYMDWARNNRIPLVVFSGGDPTEHLRFADLVIEALWRELVVQVETHGRRFADANNLKCFGSGRRFSFVIPLHGATAAVHDSIVGRKGAFEMATQGIRNIKKHLVSPVACMSVIQTENIRCIPDIAQLCSDLGVDQYFCTLVQLCGSAKMREPDIFPLLTEITRCVEQTASSSMSSHLFFNNVPFCLMKNHCNLSINYPPSHPIGESFELLCYPGDSTRDYMVLKTLFPKRPTCDICLPGACSRFPTHPSVVQCNSEQRSLMGRYCSLCEGCFFRKVCPGLPLVAAGLLDLTPIKKVTSEEGIAMITGAEPLGQARQADASHWVREGQ